MRKGPIAHTDVANEQALRDLAMGTPARSTRRSAIVQEDAPDEAPMQRGANPRIKWQCSSCRTWVREAMHRHCLACRETEKKA